MSTRFQLEEGWLTFLLLWGMLIVAGLAVLQADWISGLQAVPLTATLSLVAGLALAKSRFPSRTAHLFSFVYGLFVIFYLIGDTFPESMIWRERIFDIVNRQVDWVQKAVNEGTSRDGLIFVIQTSAIFWILGYSAAWYTFRKPRIWHVFIPTGLVLLSVVYYYAGPKQFEMSLYMAAYILLGLLFIARTHLSDQEKIWRASSVRYERGIWFNFMRSALVVSLISIMAATALPALSASSAVSDAFGRTRGPWQRFQDDWTRLFASLRSYGTAVSDPYQDSLVLGGPRTVGTTLIMDVYVPRELPYIYWQAIVYDTYDDGTWRASRDTSTDLHFPDDGLINTPLTSSREVITQTVVNFLPNSSTLYAAPEVVGSDRQMFINSNEDEKGAALVSSVRSRHALRQGDRYKVVSRVSNANATALRAASTEYPAWIVERYLQVPNTITPETLALAEELTASYDNPFDKSIAVRDWLRGNIEYNDQIQAAPENMDSVHYTLFVLQEGYCNYYASAMAMMLRSQGVPARVVSGYAQGEYGEDSRSYRVRASNAHTWVEVYFPRYGWIQFEPTAAIPTISRPEREGGGGGDAFATGSNEGPDFDGRDFLEEEEAGLLDRLPDDINGSGGAVDQQSGFALFISEIPMWQFILGSIIITIAGILVVSAGELNKRVERDVTKSYTRLGSWARWLGLLFQPANTPYERADMIITAVPEGTTPIRKLTQQYVLKQFSESHAEAEQFDPSSEWKQLRPILMRKAITARLIQFRNKLRRRRRRLF